MNHLERLWIATFLLLCSLCCIADGAHSRKDGHFCM